jgi:hypothetical protein
MKKIILATLLLLSVNSIILSQNRFDRRQGVRSTYEPKFYDGRDLLELATSIYEQRKAKAIKDCMVGFRETFESVVGNKNVVDDKQFVDSEWIRILHYIEIKDMTAMIIMTTRDGDKYIFKTNREIFDDWIAAPSKGRFYHSYVRDNARMSMVVACEEIVTSN